MALIPLRGKKYAGLKVEVDDEDVPLVDGYNWYAQKQRNTFYAQGYRQGGKSGQIVLMHTLILKPKPGKKTDHIDGNGLNNKRSNLRYASSRQNSMNQKKRKRESTSRYRGVTKAKNRWRVQIFVNGKNISRSAATEEEAAHIYNDLARQHYGEYARLNEID